VTVRNWRGKINVDIREFYPKDGNLLPGKKGLIFSPPLFVYFVCVCLWCFFGVSSFVIGF
jgi:hypothetical protein